MKEIAYADLPSLPGADLGRSEWFAVDQARVNAFADATDDHQWIHVDTARAAAEGGTIAHGFLTLSLLPRLMDELLRITGVARMLNYGVNRVRFTQPVPTGARIRLQQTVKTVEPRAGGMQVVTDCVIELEGSERPACVVESVMLVFPAPSPADADPAATRLIGA